MMSKLEAAKTLFLRNLDRLEGAELKEFCDWAQDVLDESQYGTWRELECAHVTMCVVRQRTWRCQVRNRQSPRFQSKQ